MPSSRALANGIVIATTALLAGCSSEAPAQDEIGSVEQAVCAPKTDGDWSQFPNGDGTKASQCVHGVSVFYTAKFGVPRLAASAGPVGNCAFQGACNLWVNPKNQPSTALWNRYAWGTETPQLYDLVIYPPPTSASGYGHVASVDHMSGSTLYVMDMNWNDYPLQKAPCSHDIKRTPYGFYRLKSLEPAKSCDRSAGGFTFSCDGTEASQSCVNVNEPGDPSSWTDDFFCYSGDLGMKWSSAGKIAEMDCTQVGEGSSKYATAWADDYLCLPHQSPFAFSYSSAGAIAGKNCVQWNEPLAESFSDNFVCTDPVYQFSNGGFTFSEIGTVAGKSCVNTSEAADAPWADNFFCAPTDIGMKWSSAGTIAGMDCTNVNEPGDKLAAAWSDNYLCLPKTDLPSYRFTWSVAGPIAGKTCVRWFDHGSASAAAWLDNWMCIDELKSVVTDAGPTDDAGRTTDTGDAGDAGPPDDAMGQPLSGSCAIDRRGEGARNDVLWLALGATAIIAGRRRRRTE